MSTLTQDIDIDIRSIQGHLNTSSSAAIKVVVIVGGFKNIKFT